MSRAARLAIVLAVVLVAAVLVVRAIATDHWLLHPLVGRGYQFWSGVAGCLGIVGVLWAYLRRHNCHARGCLRLGKHPVDGTSYVVCGRHHPIVPDRAPTAEHIHEAHHKARVAAIRERT